MPIQRTDDGLQIQTFQEILEELQAAAVAPTTGIDPNLDTSADSLIGRLLAILSEREESIQQQIAAVDQDAGIDATGTALTDLALLTGTVRRQGSHSAVTLTAVITAPLPAGSRVSDSTGSVVFETTTTLAASGTVLAEALDLGPVVAPPGSLTRRVSVPSGGSLSTWTSVTNVGAAIPGTNRETDVELRARRLRELNADATGSVDAIRTAVRGVENVLDTVVINDTVEHEFEVVVYGPSALDNAIAQAIWDNAPAGIASVNEGGTADAGDAVDSEGFSHLLTFTRAVEVPVYVTVNLLVDEDYPLDGDDQVATSLTASIATVAGGIGEDVIQSRLYAAVYSVSGVIDVTDLFIGTSPSPAGTANVAISTYEVATAGTIVVNS
jgi:uncharacterized phage protein gp47/JayE